MMPIVFKCACGKRLQVKDESAGKTCVCPGCGERNTIPKAGAETVSISKAPAPTTAPRTIKSAAPATRAAARDDDDDEPAPKARKGKKPAPKRSAPVMGYVMIGSGALLIVVGLVIWFMQPAPAKQPTPEPPKPVTAEIKDLDLIPSDALGFAAVQLGPWWSSPPGKKLQQQIAPLAPNDFIEENLGVHPDTIQRLIAVQADERDTFVVVRTNAPTPRDKAAARIVPNAAPTQEGGRTLYVNAGKGLLFYNDQLYVMGHPDLLKRMATAPPPPPRKGGAVDDALAEIDKHLIVVALNLASKSFQSAKPLLPANAGQFSALVQSQAALVTIDIDDDLKLLVQATLPSAELAAKARKEFQDLIQQGRTAVGFAKLQAPPEFKEAANASFTLVDSMLRSARVEQTGERAQVSLQTEKGTFTEQIKVLVPAVQSVRNAAQKQIDMNNLHQLALAMHNYAIGSQCLPSAAICSADGKPLLSWRVAMLPFLEQNDLYSQFHLNEAWDSPHNMTLLEKMPSVFASPNGVGDKQGATRYRVFTGDQAAFPLLSRKKGMAGAFGRPFTEFTDGTSNTALIFETAEPVEWTKPEDMPYDPKGKLPKMGGTANGFHAAFADGSVRLLPRSLDEKTLRAIITPAGGEIVKLP
jgi:hypothetical protein